MKTKKYKQPKETVESLKRELCDLSFELDQSIELSNLVAKIGLRNIIVFSADGEWLGCADSFVTEGELVSITLKKVKED